MEQYIATFIRQRWDYQSSVEFVTGTNQIKDRVRSPTDASKFRYVVMPGNTVRYCPHCCCAHSFNGTGLTHLQGASVVGEKHGYTNMQRFIAKRPLSMV